MSHRGTKAKELLFVKLVVNNHNVITCWDRYKYSYPKGEGPQTLAAMNLDNLKNQQFIIILVPLLI